MVTDASLWIWLAIGVGLIVSEIFLPGLVAIFFGFSALVVALLHYLGILTDFSFSLLVWGLLSLTLVLFVRKLAIRYLPSEKSKGETNEKLSDYEAIVEVIENVTEENSDGRIRYQGTSWAARSQNGEILKGQKARLIVRDNLVWIVEPLPQIESAHVVPPLSNTHTETKTVAVPDDTTSKKNSA